MKKLIALAFAVLFVSCKDDHANLPDGLYAEIDTNKGKITVMLDYESTPVTVANFVSLAEGTNTFVDKNFKGKRFYDGRKWHRVIPNFMIQGGDPLGNGSGDAGYKFKDEITDLRHDGPGVLSMANSGPNTNSSQFFITHVETPWLDGKHTVFGHVIGNGMDVVNKIVQDDAILSVTIIRIGEAAKKFDAPKVFSNYFNTQAESRKKAQADANAAKQDYYEKNKAAIDAQVAYFDNARKSAVKTDSGLSYAIVKKGSGEKPRPGQTISIQYAGFFTDGILFDTSRADLAKRFGTFDETRAAQDGYSPIKWAYGNRQGMIPGFIEALDHVGIGDKAVIFIPSALGYGEAGREPVIPANADLIFEIEISK